MNKNFYQATKVGVILQVDSISFYRTGSQGLLDIALTIGNKYRDPLKKIETVINPTEKLKLEIAKVLESKSKQYEFIEEKIDVDKFKKFEKTGEGKFFNRDLRELKSRYNIDEVMIIRVNYGLLVSYYSMIEIGWQGQATISNSIINLDNNALLFQDRMLALEKLKGKWNTPPDYQYLNNAIRDAITKCWTLHKAKF
jgi:hypothetical protein